MTVVWLFFLLRMIWSPRLRTTYGSVFPGKKFKTKNFEDGIKILTRYVHEYQCIPVKNNMMEDF